MWGQHIRPSFPCPLLRQAWHRLWRRPSRYFARAKAARAPRVCAEAECGRCHLWPLWQRAILHRAWDKSCVELPCQGQGAHSASSALVQAVWDEHLRAAFQRPLLRRAWHAPQLETPQPKTAQDRPSRSIMQGVWRRHLGPSWQCQLLRTTRRAPGSRRSRHNRERDKAARVPRVCAEVECGTDISDRRRNTLYCGKHGGQADKASRLRTAAQQVREARVCVECGASISERGNSALYCTKHSSPLAWSKRYGDWAREGRPARACAQCGKDISELRTNARYCPQHASMVPRYRAAARKFRMKRICKEEACAVNIGDRPPGARYCVEHGREKAVRSRHLATKRAHETRQNRRRSPEGRAALRARAQERRNVPGGTRNFRKLTQDSLRKIETGETVLCGICGQTIRRREDYQTDHIVPVTKGGTDDWDNLQPAHSSCNRSKGNRLLVATQSQFPLDPLATPLSSC